MGAHWSSFQWLAKAIEDYDAIDMTAAEMLLRLENFRRQNTGKCRDTLSLSLSHDISVSYSYINICKLWQRLLYLILLSGTVLNITRNIQSYAVYSLSGSWVSKPNSFVCKVYLLVPYLDLDVCFRSKINGMPQLLLPTYCVIISIHWSLKNGR